MSNAKKSFEVIENEKSDLEAKLNALNSLTALSPQIDDLCSICPYSSFFIRYSVVITTGVMVQHSPRP